MRKLSKNVKALGIVSLLNDASTDMIYPLIPIFLTKVLGASFVTVGIIEGIAESTASLLKVFSGWLSDKLRQRKSLAVIGYSLSMISKPMLAFAQSSLHVLAVRFFDRFGKGIRQAPRDALIAESTPDGMLGYSYGFHKAMDTIGATLGPLLAFLILPVLNNNLRSLFLLSFVASFFAVLTLGFFVKEKKEKQIAHVIHKLTFKSLPATYKLFLLAIAVFTIGNSSDAFLFLRAQNLGISPTLIPVLYALANIFFAGLAIFFGRLADRIGAKKIFLAGYLVFAATYFGFGLARSSFAIWLLFPLYGVFSAMTDSIQKTITVQIADPDWKGTMLGLTHTTIGIFQLPASVIAGFLWQKTNASAPFYFGSATAIIAAILLSFVFLSTKRKRAA